jgi:serine/threonine protein kinase
MAKQIAAIMTAVHKKGVAHRDLKPENLMMGSDGNITLVDFGVSKQFSKEDPMISERGTPR